MRFCPNCGQDLVDDEEICEDCIEAGEFDDNIEPEPDDSMDGDFDSGMASAGFGTDEDYGDYGQNEMDYGEY